MGNENKNSKYVEFEAPCPSCRNNDTIYWVHSNDHEPHILSSPNKNGPIVLINNEGNIKCSKSNCYYNEHPIFIMD